MFWLLNAGVVNGGMMKFSCMIALRESNIMCPCRELVSERQGRLDDSQQLAVEVAEAKLSSPATSSRVARSASPSQLLSMLSPAEIAMEPRYSKFTSVYK